jgi:CubicO group peptidase (beta-lactamase class C family)
MNSVNSLVEKSVCIQMPTDFHMDHWQDGPLNRWAFQHISDFLTTNKICAEENHHQLIHRKISVGQNFNSLENMDINVDGKIFKLTQILNDTYTDSILVLHKGNVVYERYFNNMTTDSKHLLQSVSKSILGVLYAIMIDKGVIDPEQKMGYYLPELNACVFGSATISQALDMQVALNFIEDYASPYSEMNQLDRACGWKTNPNEIYPTLRLFLLSLKPRLSDTTKMNMEHGSGFQYCSATTDVLTWLISHVSGMTYAKLLEKELWIPMGAYQNANITVDSAGMAVGNGGISCTTLDMAIFGQLIINGGKSPTGTQLIPLSWIEQTYGTKPYKNQWWVNPSTTQHDSNEIHARGIYGQYLFIDKKTDTVIAKFSSNPIAKNSPKFAMHMALFRTICDWFQNTDYT